VRVSSPATMQGMRPGMRSGRVSNSPERAPTNMDKNSSRLKRRLDVYWQHAGELRANPGIAAILLWWICTPNNECDEANWKWRRRWSGICCLEEICEFSGRSRRKEYWMLRFNMVICWCCISRSRFRESTIGPIFLGLYADLRPGALIPGLAVSYSPLAQH